MKKATLFFVVILILAGCTSLPVTQVSETAVSTLTESPTETPKPQNTLPIIIDEPTEVTITNALLPLSRIDLLLYANGNYVGEVRDGWFSKESVITSMKRWEFSEHGETAEYCYDATASFYIQEFSARYHQFNVVLKPPQLRSLLKVFDEINEGGYLIEVITTNDDIKFGNVVDESGNIIWSENIWEEPADLTPIEKAFLDYRHRVDVNRYYLREYTETESAKRYIDSGICLEFLNERMEWEDTEFEPIKNEGMGQKYIITSHQKDNWSVLEIGARNAFAYDKIIRSNSEKKLIILSASDLPVCSDRDNDPSFLFSVFDSKGNELPCGKTLTVNGWPYFHILTIPKDGYVTIKDKDYENDGWVETVTLNLSDNALLKYADGGYYPWRFELDYLHEYYNGYGRDNWSPDLSELTLEYPEEEIVDYLNSLGN